jgi:hypothetical protein
MKIKEGPLSGYPILQHFERNPESSTIRALAKAIGQSYGWTNQHVHLLTSAGVLTLQRIGASALVAPSVKHPLCIALFCVVGAQRSQSPEFKEARDAASNALLSSAHTVYLKDNEVIGVGSHTGQLTIGSIKVTLVYAPKPSSLAGATPLKGFEYFYSIRGGLHG